MCEFVPTLSPTESRTGMSNKQITCERYCVREENKDTTVTATLVAPAGDEYEQAMAMPLPAKPGQLVRLICKLVLKDTDVYKDFEPGPIAYINFGLVCPTFEKI